MKCFLIKNSLNSVLKEELFKELNKNITGEKLRIKFKYKKGLVENENPG